MVKFKQKQVTLILLALLSVLIGAAIAVPLPAKAQDIEIFMPVVGTSLISGGDDAAKETEWARLDSLSRSAEGRAAPAFTPGTAAGTIRLEGVEDEANVIGLPDADASSGRFISIVRGLSSLGDTPSVGGESTRVTLRIPASLKDEGFKLFIFDGDMRKGAGGGTWDAINPDHLTADNMTYRLYPDPTVQGNTTGELYSWTDGEMRDNDWCQLTTAGGCSDDGSHTIPMTPAALDARPAGQNTGDYYYHLVIEFDEPTFPTDGLRGERNDFKVAVTGQPYLRGGSTVGFIGFGPNDPLPSRFPATNYTGEFAFDFFVPTPTDVIELWDGDLDYYAQTEPLVFAGDEDDDGNSPDFPPFPFGSETQEQGVRPGNGPSDGLVSVKIGETIYENNLLVGGTPKYTITGDDYSAENLTPSGNQEWERFVLAINGSPDIPAEGADATVGNYGNGDRFGIGLYRWVFNDVDGRNLFFVHLDYDLYPAGVGSIGNLVWLERDGVGNKFDGDPDECVTEPPFPEGDFGLGGVLVLLYKDDGDGIYSPGDQLVDQQLTDCTGHYLFTNVPLGVYHVVIADSNFTGALAGLTQVAGEGPPNEDDYNRVSPHTVVLDSNLAYLRADFGYEDNPGQSSNGSIGDLVWEDANGNGLYDSGDEDPIQGVIVNLYRETSPGVWTFVGSDTTDVNGNYLFTALPGGNYRVEVDSSNFVSGGVLEDKVQTPAIVPNPGPDGNNKNHAMPWEVTLPPDGNYLWADFGYFGTTVCVVDKNDPTDPDTTGTVQWYFSTFNDTPVVVIRGTLPRGFADTTYGTPANNRWSNGTGGRSFGQVLHSDHMEFALFGNNDSENPYMQFKVDLLAAVDPLVTGVVRDGQAGNVSFSTDGSFNPAGPGPFQSAGLSGGDSGPHFLCTGFQYCFGGGDAYEVNAVLDVRTSFEVNLNLRYPVGHPQAGQLAWTDYANSPAFGGSEYSFDASVPPYVQENWIWDTWYEVTVALSAFDSVGGFDRATIPSLHSSPSRLSGDTIEVDECPPGQEPPPPPIDPCANCTDRIEELTFRYDGGLPAAIRVVQTVDNTIVFNEIVLPGHQFKASGEFQSPQSWLGPDTAVYINGVFEATLSTDCTPVLTAGAQFGRVNLVSMLNQNGGNGCGVP